MRRGRCFEASRVRECASPYHIGSEPKKVISPLARFSGKCSKGETIDLITHTTSSVFFLSPFIALSFTALFLYIYRP